MKRKYIFLICIIAVAQFSWAQELTYLIDVPTAEVTPYGEYDMRFRFYSEGGILNRLTFGVLNRINLGFAWDLEEVIGSDDVDVNEPTLHLKLRFFDGSFVFPALALGYDGQGYFFDKNLDEYLQREKGVFIVGTQELFFPELELTAGANIYDFEEDELYGYTGVSYMIHPVIFIGEYDNIHQTEFNRINASIRLLVTSAITVDLAARDVGAKRRDEERIVRINCRGAF